LRLVCPFFHVFAELFVQPHDLSADLMEFGPAVPATAQGLNEFVPSYDKPLSRSFQFSRFHALASTS
jgi:hypothetical protein